MPEAIATTKRKFYKALDALTTSSQTSLHPPNAADSTSSSKRSSAAAFDEARERVRKRLRQSTSTDSLTNLDHNSSIISLPRKSTTSNATAKPPPNFSPWSQEQFLARLKTFSSVSLWHPKPDSINEVEWAKRGWVCVDVNTVACKGGCERRVVVSLDLNKAPQAIGDDEDEDDSADFENALAERYKSQIVEGHSRSCLWHDSGCKDDIYRLSVVRPTVWQPELRQRFRSLMEISKSVEQLKTRPLDTYSEKALNDLPRDVLGLTDSPGSGSGASTAFEIAMHGWRGSTTSGNDLLHCDACFQRIGLWMYQPDYKPSRSSDDTADCEGDDEGRAILDLAELHREHCPWRNSESQKATGSLAGLNACQVLHRVVSTAARDQRRRSDRQSAVQDETGALDDHDNAEAPAVLSREETARQDKERESRLRKLKNLFNIKRRPTTKAPPPQQKAA